MMAARRFSRERLIGLTSEAQLLFAAANEPKKLLTFAGAGHNVFGSQGEQYFDQVVQFIRESIALR